MKRRNRFLVMSLRISPIGLLMARIILLVLLYALVARGLMINSMHPMSRLGVLLHGVDDCEGAWPVLAGPGLCLDEVAP